MIQKKKNKKLELEVEELREWKRKEQEKKGEEEEEEEEEEEPDQTEIDLFKNIDSKIINTQEEFSLLYKRLKKNSELIVRLISTKNVMIFHILFQL